jgi:YidC/Oxa1 family membrane protein insertase
VVIPPRGVLTNVYDLYLGPKELERLKALNVELDRAIDYGWFHSLAKPFVLVLKALYSFSGNYGIAIFLLTLAVRLLFYPLNQMSYRSMKEMQKLQPKILELREKYKDDKDKLNRETMELYRQHKVNPFGGCLPILIQIPVFIALYQALMKSIELRHAPFVWWIKDLSSPELLFTVCIIPSFCIPVRLLPVLMGITTFIQQKMTPTTGDPQQAKMMLWFMPIMLSEKMTDLVLKERGTNVADLRKALQTFKKPLSFALKAKVRRLNAVWIRWPSPTR